MRSSIYKCRSPFMSRMNQFEAGKHTLVCGILESVIMKGKGDFGVVLGESKIIHKISFDKLRSAVHNVWINPRGKRVWIVPVSELSKESPIKTEIPSMPVINKLF